MVRHKPTKWFSDNQNCCNIYIYIYIYIYILFSNLLLFFFQRFSLCWGSLIYRPSRVPGPSCSCSVCWSHALTLLITYIHIVLNIRLVDWSTRILSWLIRSLVIQKKKLAKGQYLRSVLRAVKSLLFTPFTCLM